MSLPESYYLTNTESLAAGVKCSLGLILLLDESLPTNSLNYVFKRRELYGF